MSPTEFYKLEIKRLFLIYPAFSFLQCRGSRINLFLRNFCFKLIFKFSAKTLWYANNKIQASFTQHINKYNINSQTRIIVS